VSSDVLRVFAIALTATWILSAVLALSIELRAGVLLNMLVSVIIGALRLPRLGEFLLDYEGYVRRYGAAAVHDVWLTAAAVALSLVAIGFSLAALRFGRALFVLGWLTNAPMITLLIYLAFWFRIF